jgi:hypothetical protein
LVIKSSLEAISAVLLSIRVRTGNDRHKARSVNAFVWISFFVYLLALRLIVISYHRMKVWLSIPLDMPRTGSFHNGIIELFRPSGQPIDIECVLA